MLTRSHVTEQAHSVKERPRPREGKRNAAMADNKRNSVAGKIATPNLKVGGGGSNKDVIDADSNLHKAVGSRSVIPTLCLVQIADSS